MEIQTHTTRKSRDYKRARKGEEESAEREALTDSATIQERGTENQRQIVCVCLCLQPSLKIKLDELKKFELSKLNRNIC